MVSLFVTILCTIEVPLFYMISGTLLLSRNESLKDLFRKRILRFGLVLVLFSALQYCAHVLRNEFSDPSLSDFIKRLLTGDIQETYGFLYYYLGILMILPLLRRSAQHLSDEEFRYIFLFRIIMDVIIVLGNTLPFGLVESNFMQGCHIFLSNVWYVLMGYYCGNRLKATEKSYTYTLPFIISLGLPIALISILYATTGVLNDPMINLTASLSAVCAFMAVRQSCPIITTESGFSGRTDRIYLFLGRLVFGAYLTEWFARCMYLPVYLYLTEHSVGLIASGVYWLLSLVTAFIFSYCLHKIPLLKSLI